jgi:uncharacterized damage-inducible protein DinB
MYTRTPGFKRLLITPLLFLAACILQCGASAKKQSIPRIGFLSGVGSMQYILTVIVALLFCEAANAQFNEAAKTQLVKEWQRAKVYTLEYLNAMPKDKYGFKAQDSIRSFAQQMLHLAQDIIIMVFFGSGKERIWQGQKLEQRLSAQTADSVRYFVTAGYDYVIDAIQNMDASKFEEIVKDRSIEETRFAWLLKAFEHQTHHRSQTTIYIRLLGIKPSPERLF